MKKIVIIVVFFAAIISLKYLLKEPAINLPVYGSVPEFEFISQDNKKISQKDYLEKVWVVSFIFTNFPAQCPMMTSSMRKIQEKTNQLKNIYFVSISIDPENDNPDRLRKYIELHSVNVTNWDFLTGDEKLIHKFAEETFKLSSGKEDPNLHSTKFVLVDKQANIRGYYDSQESNSDIVSDIGRLVSQ